MSQRNGDRARADLQRNARIHDRYRIRELRKAAQKQAPSTVEPPRPANTPAAA